MPGIFINYRRDDAPGVAGRLYDYLAKKFSRRDLFMDVDAIKPGLDFVKQLDNQVSNCDVLLALIGPHWLNATDEKGQRRLAADRDYVRIEIAAALKRDIPVIPVLVDGARMPSEDELPEDLANLSRRHALELRHTRFAADADAIVASLKDHLAKPTKNWVWPVAAALLLGALGLATGIYLWSGPRSETEIAAPTDTQIATPAEPQAPPSIESPAAEPPKDAPSPAPASEAVADGNTSPPPSSTVEEMRRRLEEARKEMEEAKRKAEAAKNAAAAQLSAQAPASSAAGRLKAFSVVPGAQYAQVRAAYPMAAEDKNYLKLPLDGVYFEFTEDDHVLRVIRAEAPFSGSVNGISIGDTGDDVAAKMGRQPNHVAQVYNGSGYAYEMGGYTLRFDVDKSNQVVQIWQILDRE